MQDIYENELIRISCDSTLVNGTNQPKGNRREGLDNMFNPDVSKKTLFWNPHIELSLTVKKNILIKSYTTANDEPQRDVRLLKIDNQEYHFGQIKERHTVVDLGSILVGVGEHILRFENFGIDQWNQNLVQLAYLDIIEADTSTDNNDTDDDTVDDMPTTPATFNVKDFGAVGDGVIDDTVAIRNAFEKAKEFARNYNLEAITYFPNGKYNVSIQPEDGDPSGKYILTFDCHNLTLSGESVESTEIVFHTLSPETGEGMSDPSTNWSIIGDGRGYGKIARGGLFENGPIDKTLSGGLHAANNAPTNITIKNITLNGNASPSFNTAVGGQVLDFTIVGEYLYRNPKTLPVGSQITFGKEDQALPVGLVGIENEELKNYFIVGGNKAFHEISEVDRGVPVNLTDNDLQFVVYQSDGNNKWKGRIIDGKLFIYDFWQPDTANEWKEGYRKLLFTSNNGLPNGVVLNKYYYIVNANDGRFQISDSPMGDSISISHKEDSTTTIYRVMNGRGWDMSHKGYALHGGEMDNINFVNTHWKNFRGEIIHSGGDKPKNINFIDSIFELTDASMISCGGNIKIDGCILRNGYNGIENYSRMPWHGTTVINSKFTNDENLYPNPKFAVVYIGLPSAFALIENNEFYGWNYGVFLSESAFNVEIRNNIFNLGKGTPLHWVRLGMYPNDAEHSAKYNDITVSGNTFIASGETPIYLQGPREMRNFRIENNQFLTNSDGESWRFLMRSFVSGTPELWENFLITDNYLEVRAGYFPNNSSVPRPTYQNNIVWDKLKDHQEWPYRIDLYNEQQEGSIRYIAPASPWPILFNNHYSKTNTLEYVVSIPQDSIESGVYPIGFEFTIKSGATGHIKILSSGWSNQEHPIILGPAGSDLTEVTFRMGNTGLFEVVEPLIPNVFNVKRFGAVGDGKHDDTTAIRAAIDAAKDNGGGEVIFPSGTYNVAPTGTAVVTVKTKTVDQPWEVVKEKVSAPEIIDQVVFSYDGPDDATAAEIWINLKNGHVFKNVDGTWIADGSLSKNDGTNWCSGWSANPLSETDAKYYFQYYVNLDNMSCVFLVTPHHNNITFKGEDAEISFHCWSMIHPMDYEVDKPNSKILRSAVSPKSGGRFHRGFLFRFHQTTKEILFDNIHFDGLKFSGNTTTDGTHGWYNAYHDLAEWDTSHKAIALTFGGQTMTNISITGCNFVGWRGEIVYKGGANLCWVNITNCSFDGSNGSAVSISGNMVMDGCVFRNVYNVVENYCHDGQFAEVRNCHFHMRDNFTGKFGVVYLGENDHSYCIIENNRFENAGISGIFFSDFANNVTIVGNEFIDCPWGIYWYYMALYKLPGRYRNMLIKDNKFIARNKNMDFAMLQAADYWPADNWIIDNNEVIAENGFKVNTFLQDNHTGPWDRHDVTLSNNKTKGSLLFQGKGLTPIFIDNEHSPLNINTWTAKDGKFYLVPQNPKIQITWVPQFDPRMKLIINGLSKLPNGMEFDISLNAGVRTLELPVDANRNSFQESVVISEKQTKSFKFENGLINLVEEVVESIPLVWETEFLPSGEEGFVYQSNIKAYGGTAPLTYRVTSGPSFITVQDDGNVIANTPEKGDYILSVVVEDVNGQQIFKDFPLNIQEKNTSPVFVGEYDFSVRECETSSFLLQHEAGNGSIIFQKVGGPLWTTISENGKVTIEPPENSMGNYELEASVTDEDGDSQTKVFEIQILEKNTIPQVVTETYFDAFQNDIYQQDIEVIGGNHPISLKFVGAPFWITMENSKLSASPNNEVPLQIYKFKLVANDVDGDTHELEISCNVLPPKPVVTNVIEVYSDGSIITKKS